MCSTTAHATVMPTHFSVYPLNYARFVTLACGATRTPSPTRELQQMIHREVILPAPPHLLSSSLPPHRPAHPRTRRRRSCTPGQPSPSFSCALSGRTEVIDVDALPEDDYLPTTMQSRAKDDRRHTQEQDCDCVAAAVCDAVESMHDRTAESDAPHATTAHGLPCRGRTSPQTLADAQTGVADRSRQDEAKPSGEWRTPAVAPPPWFYGSPLYDVVSQQYFCWNGHVLQRRARDLDYEGSEGVCCDFCGDISWSESVPLVPTRRSLGAPTAAHAPPSAAATTGSTLLPKEVDSFLHCDTCDMDVCARCAHDIATRERFHLPALQCMRCSAYVALHTAAVHRCCDRTGAPERGAGDAVVLTTSPPSSFPPACSTTEECAFAGGLESARITGTHKAKSIFDKSARRVGSLLWDATTASTRAIGHVPFFIEPPRPTASRMHTECAAKDGLCEAPPAMGDADGDLCAPSAGAVSVAHDGPPTSTRTAAQPRHRGPSSRTQQPPLPRPGSRTHGLAHAVQPVCLSRTHTFIAPPTPTLTPSHVQDDEPASADWLCRFIGDVCGGTPTATTDDSPHEDRRCDESQDASGDENGANSRVIAPSCLWEVYVRVPSSRTARVVREMAARYAVHRCRAARLPQPRSDERCQKEVTTVDAAAAVCGGTGVVFHARTRLDAERFATGLQDAELMGIVRPSFSEKHYFMHTAATRTFSSPPSCSGRAER